MAAAGAVWFPVAPAWTLAGLGAMLAFVAQIGDAVESALKRHFGVKDASRLIPGHGGALDRLDGMIFAALAFAAVLHVYGAPG